MNTLRFLSEFQQIAPMNELLLLLSKVTGATTTKLLIQDDLELTGEQQTSFNFLAERLINGDPLPYILGEWGFYDLMFEVSPAVLIPRPETEMIIDLVLDRYSDKAAKISFLDVGTGSGIIPVTLAKKFPNAYFYATDISPSALEIAKRNAIKHEVADRFRFWLVDLLPAELTAQKFSVITANLPYIPSDDVKNLDIYGREPTIALDGGNTGIEIIENLMIKIIAQKILFSALILEIEYRQASETQRLGTKYFPDKSTTTLKDLAGNDRITIIA